METQVREWNRKESLQDQIGAKQKILSVLSSFLERPGTSPGTSELLWSVLKKQLCLGTGKVTPASTGVILVHGLSQEPQIHSFPRWKP